MRHRRNNLLSSSHIQRILKRLDWDSRDASHAEASFGFLHWYPATFIPNIPANLIEVLTREGDTIWDPFCGAGSVGIEALKRNRNFIGNDINNIAVDIANAKIALCSNKEKLFEAYRKIKNDFFMYSINLIDTNEDIKYFQCLKEENIKELSKWYSSSVFKKLFFIKKYLETSIYDQEIKNFFNIIFLHVARYCCAQDKSWGHIADNVKPNKSQIQIKAHLNPFQIYIEHGDKIFLKIQQAFLLSNITVNAEAYYGDSRIFNPSREVDIVITSPPYPWMCDYITSQRLAYLWSDICVEDIFVLRTCEVGPRTIRRRRDRSEIYIRCMIECLGNIEKYLRKDGLFCLVLPGANDKNEDRSKALTEIYRYISTQFEEICSFERFPDLHRRSSPFVTLESETISVWRK